MTYSPTNTSPIVCAQLRLDRRREHRGAGDERDADQHRRRRACGALRVALHVAARHRAGDAAHRCDRRAEHRGDRVGHHRSEQQHAGEDQHDGRPRAARRRRRRAPRRSRRHRRRRTPHGRRPAGARRRACVSNADSLIAATGATRPAAMAGTIGRDERRRRRRRHRDGHGRTGRARARATGCRSRTRRAAPDADRQTDAADEARAATRRRRRRAPRASITASPAGGWRRWRAAARSRAGVGRR